MDVKKQACRRCGRYTPCVYASTLAARRAGKVCRGRCEQGTSAEGDAETSHQTAYTKETPEPLMAPQRSMKGKIALLLQRPLFQVAPFHRLPLRVSITVAHIVQVKKRLE